MPDHEKALLFYITKNYITLYYYITTILLRIGHLCPWSRELSCWRPGANIMLVEGKWKLYYVVRGILGIEQSTLSLVVESR